MVLIIEIITAVGVLVLAVAKASRVAKLRKLKCCGACFEISTAGKGSTGSSTTDISTEPTVLQNTAT